MVKCEFKFKTKFGFRKAYFITKIIFFIIFFIFFKNCKTNKFNKLNKDIKYYYSYTKYKIYNRIKKKKSLKNITLGIYITSLYNGGRERITSLLISCFNNK